MVRAFEASISLSSFENPDVLGIGMTPPRLVVNIHPASTHALNLDSPTIHFNFICVDNGDGHFGGSVSSPPFNQ